jgi:tetratricopeptide (TPR) repeat protein
MRRLNVRLLIWLVATTAPAAVGVHLLHGFQVGRNADTLVARAREKRATGEADEAVRLLSRYVGLRPDDAAASAELATTLLTRLETIPPTRRDVARAFAALESAVRDNPADAPLRLKLAEFCVRLGRHADAEQHLALLPSSRVDAADEADVAMIRGRAAIGTGNHAEAVRILAAVVGFDPEGKTFIAPAVATDADSATVLAVLATLFNDAFDDPATADLIMRRLPAVASDDPQVWITLARWHLYRNDLAEAVAAATRSRRLAADDAEAALVSFEVAVASGDNVTAAQVIAEGLAAHPDDERLHRARGLLAIRRGNPVEAVAAIRAGLARQPASSPLLAMLAELLLEQGDPAAAREAIDALIAQEGHEPPSVAFLEGWHLVETHRWLEAKRVLQQLRPQVLAADQVRRRVDLLLTRCYAALGMFDEQLAVCQTVLAETPELMSARRDAATALAALGRPAEALDLLNAAPAQLPHEGGTLRAECLLALGRVDDAIAYLTAAGKQTPDDPRVWATLVEATLRQRGPLAAREQLEKIAPPLAATPPLLVARGLIAASLPANEAEQEFTAIEAAASALAADDRRGVLAGLARLAAGRGDRDSAARLWGVICDAHPDDLVAWWQRYDLAAAASDIEAAEACVEAIERITDGSSADGRTARAGLLLLRVAGSSADGSDTLLDEARHLLLEAEAERPRWQRIQLFFAGAHRLRGDSEAERECLEQALACGPLSVRQRVILADLRDRLGRWDECRTDLQSLAASADAPPAITALLIGKLIDHEELDAARSWLAKLTRNTPGAAGLLSLEARLAAASGDHATASRLQAEFDAARGKEPGSPALKRP